MASPITVAKAEAARLALSSLLGSSPIVTYMDTYARIQFTPEQSTAFRTMIDAQAVSQGQSDVEIDFLPVVLPVLLKKALPVAAGLIVAGYLLGRSSRKR